jgi:hypothetical protein
MEYCASTDPSHCGGGTTLLAAQRVAKQHGLTDLDVVGIERNPFLHFVARTKLRWHEFNPSSVRSHATYLLNGAVKTSGNPIPELSTFEKGMMFEPELLDYLLGLNNVIRDELRNLPDRDVVLLGFAAALESVSRARKDGRALRIEPRKQRPPVSEALERAWKNIEADLYSAVSHYEPVKSQVLYGDGRTLKSDGVDIEMGQFDIVLYSPPYLNNIDYTEVYKIELWLCGFVASKEQFRNLRKKTFRSHPSVRFPGVITFDQDPRMQPVREVLDALIEALPKDDDFRWRSRLFREYFDDIYVSLREQSTVLKPKGWIFCVVGNSLHGPLTTPSARVPVASDAIIGLIADCLGLEVRAIQIARSLSRRPPASPFLRESILVMQARQSGCGA